MNPHLNLLLRQMWTLGSVCIQKGFRTNPDSNIIDGFKTADTRSSPHKPFWIEYKPYGGFVQWEVYIQTRCAHKPCRFGCKPLGFCGIQKVYKQLKCAHKPCRFECKPLGLCGIQKVYKQLQWAHKPCRFECKLLRFCGSHKVHIQLQWARDPCRFQCKPLGLCGILKVHEYLQCGCQGWGSHSCVWKAVRISHWLHWLGQSHRSDPIAHDADSVFEKCHADLAVVRYYYYSDTIRTVISVPVL